MPIDFNCPHCQRQYRVDDATAGKLLKCKQCFQAIRVPSAAAPVQAPRRPVFDDEPDVGEYDLKDGPRSQNYAAPSTSASGCPSCHAPIQPGALICVSCGLNFRTGEKIATTKVANLRQTGQAWSSAGILFARHGTELPQCCIKCGEPGTRRRRRTYAGAWVPQNVGCALFFLRFITPLIALVVFLIRLRRVRITYYLCDRHVRNIIAAKLFTLFAGVVITGIGITCFAFSDTTHHSDGQLILGAILICTGPFVALCSVAAGRALRLVYIEDGVGQFSGCHPAFLRRL